MTAQDTTIILKLLGYFNPHNVDFASEGLNSIAQSHLQRELSRVIETSDVFECIMSLRYQDLQPSSKLRAALFETSTQNISWVKRVLCLGLSHVPRYLLGRCKMRCTGPPASPHASSGSSPTTSAPCRSSNAATQHSYNLSVSIWCVDMPTMNATWIFSPPVYIPSIFIADHNQSARVHERAVTALAVYGINPFRSQADTHNPSRRAKRNARATLRSTIPPYLLDTYGLTPVSFSRVLTIASPELYAATSSVNGCDA